MEVGMEAVIRAYEDLHYNGDDTSEAKTQLLQSLQSQQAGQASLVLPLVHALGGRLTNAEKDAERVSAVQLLAEMVSGPLAPTLSQGDLSHLATFFSARLADWPCVGPAAIGCTALLRRTPASGADPPLRSADALALVRALRSDVRVPALQVHERLECLRMWIAALKGFGAAAAREGEDVAGITIAVVEEESDPRCLLLAFECVQESVRALSAPDLLYLLEANAADLFDVGVWPYFPITVVDPRQARAGVVPRAQLTAALTDAMTATPLFAPFALPLLSEKLSSTLKRAKEDVVATLPVCCQRYGAAAMQPHSRLVWLMLKPELLAPAAAAEEQLPPPEAHAASARAAAAAAALAASLRALHAGDAALQEGALAREVLADVCMEDLDQYLQLGRSRGPAAESIDEEEEGRAAWVAPSRAETTRVACIARIVAAVASASPATCAAACARALHPLAARLQLLAIACALPPAEAGPARPQQPQQRQRLCQQCATCLAVACAVVSEVAAAAGRHAWASSATQALAPSLVAALQALLPPRPPRGAARPRAPGQDQPPAAAGGGQDDAPGAAAQLRVWCLRLWAALLSFPPALPHLTPPEVEEAAGHLATGALVPASEPVGLGGLGDDPGRWGPGAAAPEAGAEAVDETTVTAEALAGLRRLAAAAERELAAGVAGPGAAPAADAVRERVVPRVAARMAGAVSARSSVTADRASAVAVVREVAGAGPTVAWQLLDWLQAPALAALRAAVVAGGGATTKQDAAAAWLHCLAVGVLPELPQQLTAAQSRQAADLVADLLERLRDPAGGDSPTGGGALTPGATPAGSSPQGAQQGGAGAAEALAAPLLALVVRLTAGCTAGEQRALALDACALAAAAAAALVAPEPAPAAAPAAAAAAARQLSAAAAGGVLLALRPAVLTGRSREDLGGALLALATHPASTARAAEAAAAALAALVAKWQAPGAAAAGEGDAESDAQLASLLHALLPRRLLPQLAAAPERLAAAAARQRVAWARSVAALAWVTRALAMTGSAALPDVLHAAVSALRRLGQAEGEAGTVAAAGRVLTADGDAAPAVAPLTPEPSPGGEGAEAVATLFRLAVCDAAASDTLQLSAATHVKGRVLWQQRTFTLAAAALRAAIEGATQERAERAPLLVAAAELLAAAPAGVVQATMGEALPLMLQCLTHLPPPPLAGAETGKGSAWLAALHAPPPPGGPVSPRVAALLRSCLAATAHLLGEPQHRGPVEQHVDELVGALLSLAQIPGAAGVRAAALGCLKASMALPYHLLHPWRKRAVAVVVGALDDDARAVRAAAVAARRAWDA